MQYGVWDPGSSDQLFLGHLGAQVAALREAFGTYNRQGDVMLHAGSRFRRKEVATGRREEVHGGPILGRWRVRHVHDDLNAGERRRQALASERVDARIRRGGDNLMSARAQQANEL